MKIQCSDEKHTHWLNEPKQFIQSTGLHCTGFPNYSPPWAFNTPTPLQLHGYPEIIGEGNLISIISPDTQFVFTPTVQWRSPHLPSPNLGNLHNPYINNLGAWFVRSIYGPFQPTSYSQQYQTPCEPQHWRGSNPEYNLNVPAPGYQLKFHSDMCTSTTDLHYFIPRLNNWFENPRRPAAIPTEVRPENNTNGVVNPFVCTKPCNCTSATPCRCDLKDKPKKQSKCVKISSKMLIDELKPDMSCNKSNVTCQCTENTSADKSVKTYADKASCTEEKARQTRPASSSSVLDCGCNPHNEAKSGDSSSNKGPELWTPITPLSKKAMKSTSESSATEGNSQSGCCSGTCSFSCCELEE